MDDRMWLRRQEALARQINAELTWSHHNGTRLELTLASGKETQPSR